MEPATLHRARFPEQPSDNSSKRNFPEKHHLWSKSWCGLCGVTPPHPSKTRLSPAQGGQQAAGDGAGVLPLQPPLPRLTSRLPQPGPPRPRGEAAAPEDERDGQAGPGRRHRQLTKGFCLSKGRAEPSSPDTDTDTAPTGRRARRNRRPRLPWQPYTPRLPGRGRNAANTAPGPAGPSLTSATGDRGRAAAPVPALVRPARSPQPHLPRAGDRGASGRHGACAVTCGRMRGGGRGGLRGW